MWLGPLIYPKFNAYNILLIIHFCRRFLSKLDFSNIIELPNKFQFHDIIFTYLKLNGSVFTLYAIAITLTN